MNAYGQRASPTTPAALLFAAYHLRLLAVLLMRPDQSFHLRELERLAGVSAGTAHRELKRMETAGLVHSRRIGNQVHYQAQRDCPIFAELQSILRKSVGLADVLREALAPLAEQIELAFVFGSVAKGEEGPGSDIDLLIVGEVSFADVVGALFPCHERLGREVNPLVMRRQEFEQRRQDEGFVARVLRDPILPLIGAIDDA
ncbi:MAG: nucleotidyltransferase domain-containing protein [Lysobacterales bacterium]